MFGKPLWYQESAERDERNDEHREPDSGDCLRNGDCASDAGDLKTDEEHNLLSGDSVEWFVALEEAVFGDEVEGFRYDAIGFNGTPL